MRISSSRWTGRKISSCFCFIRLSVGFNSLAFCSPTGCHLSRCLNSCKLVTFRTVPWDFSTKELHPSWQADLNPVPLGVRTLFAACLNDTQKT